MYAVVLYQLSSEDSCIQGEQAKLLNLSTRERNETRNEMISTAGIQMKINKLGFNYDGHIFEFVSFVFPQFISFHSVDMLAVDS